MRKAAAALALLLVLASAAPAPAGTAQNRALAHALETRLAKANLRLDRYGIVVLTREERPAIVFARGHTQALMPASTAKILTAATALDLLAPGHVFRTRVTARGRVDGGVLHGDLVVHGSGDPNLSGRFHDDRPTYVLETFARAVAAAGIRRVAGSLVLDDGPFDRAYVHPTWTEGDRRRWYGAPVAGLAFNDSCADIVVRGGGREGAPASVVSPSTVGGWGLENKVKTVSTGRPTVGGIWIRGDSVLRVQGTIPKGQSYPFSHPVPDPLRFFAGAFLATLEREGVVVEQGARPARDAADRTPGALEIAQEESPLGTTLEVMNRRSQNFYASLVFKATGARLCGVGSWESGGRAVAEMLRRRGLDPEHETRIVDGSGLSAANRTTAATLARLLHTFDRDLLRGPVLYASLAVPGGDGTLSHRLRTRGLEERLHAKTGTLASRGVHALAGYVDGKDGEPGYTFAILLNGVPGGRELIDDLVVEMARR